MVSRIVYVDEVNDMVSIQLYISDKPKWNSTSKTDHVWCDMCAIFALNFSISKSAIFLMLWLTLSGRIRNMIHVANNKKKNVTERREKEEERVK